MYSFKCDYSNGAHPRILKTLLETNFTQTDGYGEDVFTLKAVELLKKLIGRNNLSIHLIPGGTQTNLTAISAFLRPHEAVIACETGHVSVHETGAIEATGHKVISVKGINGKLTPYTIKSVLDLHNDEHMVKPRLVFISDTTEVGSVYSKKELTELNVICRENNLLLYLDGARLGSALCSDENDLKLNDLADLTDAFYIGGTKNGALLGEALVILNPLLSGDFRYHMKQKGGLLAKGRLLGIQFLELFKDGLYYELARHANRMAGLLKEAILKSGYSFLYNSASNQIFPVFPDVLIEKLQHNFAFYVWDKPDANNTCIRLVTSWTTDEKAVEDFIAAIQPA